MKVAVGSKNPVKVHAVQLAFEAVWPNEQFIIEGIEIDSGVSAQPMSIGESIKGARNRAQRALEKIEANYGVGLEGGIHQEGDLYFDGGWMVIINKNGEEGVGATVQIPVPEAMMKLIREGKELGEVCDLLFGQTNTKQTGGHFGLMTNNLITRKTGYKDGLIMALSRFIHPHLF